MFCIFNLRAISRAERQRHDFRLGFGHTNAGSANDRLVRAPSSPVLSRHTLCTQLLMDLVATQTKQGRGSAATADTANQLPLAHTFRANLGVIEA